MSPDLRVPRANVIAILILLVATASSYFVWSRGGPVWLAGILFAIGIILMQAPRVAEQWERAVVLRLERLYEGLKDKGALMLVPSSAVESLGMGGMLGAAAMGQARLKADVAPPIDGAA